MVVVLPVAVIFIFNAAFSPSAWLLLAAACCAQAHNPATHPSLNKKMSRLHPSPCLTSLRRAACSDAILVPLIRPPLSFRICRVFLLSVALIPQPRFSSYQPSTIYHPLRSPSSFFCLVDRTHPSPVPVIFFPLPFPDRLIDRLIDRSRYVWTYLRTNGSTP